jgi:hypothetical protein
MIPSPPVDSRTFLSPRELRKLQRSYKKATDRRIFIPPSTMAKSLGALSKSSEISDKWLWIQCKNRIPLSPPLPAAMKASIPTWRVVAQKPGKGYE